MKLTLILPDSYLERLTKLKASSPETEKMSNEEFLHHIVKARLRDAPLVDSWNSAFRKETVSALFPLWMENVAMNIADGDVLNVDEWWSAMRRQVETEGDAILAEKRNPVVPKELKESRSIWTIPKKEGKPALIVAAGPSIREHNHIKLLADRGWKGPIIATDRMLRPLLEAGVSPANGFDLHVASVDGHRMLIPLMYQDENHKPINAEGVWGFFASSVAPQTVKAAKEAGVNVRWFHGMLDDFDDRDSVSHALNQMVAGAAIQAGGNVGSTCWSLATYLRCNPIVFIGLNLGYTKDTKIEDTAYYSSYKNAGLSVAQMEGMMTRGFNPDFNCGYLMDPVFRDYRDSLLRLLEYRQEVECVFKKGMPGIYPVTTINATEGGCLHGKYVTSRKFSEVLEEYGK